MDKVVVAKLAVEGGGVTVYGIEQPGGWVFWQEGISMHLDENDDEDWRPWRSEPVSDLSKALPDIWLLMYPLLIHRTFLPWFRQHYERGREQLSVDERQMQEKHLHSQWQAALAGRTSVTGHDE
jgi:hypothetical protein